jgi:pyruvate kinase
MISKYRPKAPIVAVTTNPSVSRKLALVSGVVPTSGGKCTTTDEMIETAVQESISSGVVNHGDLIVITAGVPVGESGSTNLMKVYIVGDIIAKGQGVGRRSAFGKVVVAKNAKEANEKMTSGSVLVTGSTDRDMMEALEKASALITEEGGLTSHAAVVGLSLGIPVIVGLENATSILNDGDEITVDSSHGAVYQGRTSIL